MRRVMSGSTCEDRPTFYLEIWGWREKASVLFLAALAQQGCPTGIMESSEQDASVYQI
jgi:hypothetical protein